VKFPSASQPVFVPAIGFRPAGTRTLVEPVVTIEDGAHLTVIAVAAAPDRTEVSVEWKRTGDPVRCPPGSRVWTYSRASASLDPGLTAALMVGTNRLDAITPIWRGAYSASHSEIRVAHTMTFPPLPNDAATAELLVRDGDDEWRAPFTLVPGRVLATPLAVEAEREGIVIRASAVAGDGDNVVVAVEAEAAQQIRRVAAPVPTSAVWTGRDEDHAARTKALRRVFSERARPIVLEDERGGRSEELGRLFSRDPQRAAPGRPFVSRFSVAFGALGAGTKRATLVVPFVEVIDRDPSVRADLRNLPLDLALGEHRFRVTSADQSGSDERRIVIEIPPSSGSPQFIQPCAVQGLPSRPGYSWCGPPEQGKTFWMATAVGDPPIVTFEGAVLRVEGPWRLELALA
jgi:hypothetical protein